MDYESMSRAELWAEIDNATQSLNLEVKHPRSKANCIVYLKELHNELNEIYGEVLDEATALFDEVENKSELNEYRCTRNLAYTHPLCDGYANLQARQGYYLKANNELEVLIKMSKKFPDDIVSGLPLDQVFTATLSKSLANTEVAFNPNLHSVPKSSKYSLPQLLLDAFLTKSLIAYCVKEIALYEFFLGYELCLFANASKTAWHRLHDVIQDKLHKNEYWQAERFRDCVSDFCEPKTYLQRRMLLIEFDKINNPEKYRFSLINIKRLILDCILVKTLVLVHANLVVWIERLNSMALVRDEFKSRAWFRFYLTNYDSLELVEQQFFNRLVGRCFQAMPTFSEGDKVALTFLFDFINNPWKLVQVKAFELTAQIFKLAIARAADKGVDAMYRYYRRTGLVKYSDWKECNRDCQTLFDTFKPVDAKLFSRIQ